MAACAGVSTTDFDDVDPSDAAVPELDGSVFDAPPGIDPRDWPFGNDGTRHGWARKKDGGWVYLPPPFDAAVDAPADAPWDATTDGMADAMPDAAMDAGVEAAVDGGDAGLPECNVPSPATPSTPATDTCDSQTPIVVRSGDYRYDLTGMTATSPTPCQPTFPGRRDAAYRLCVPGKRRVVVTALSDGPGSHTASWSTSCPTGCTTPGDAVVDAGTYGISIEGYQDAKGTLRVLIEAPPPPPPPSLTSRDSCVEAAQDAANSGPFPVPGSYNPPGPAFDPLDPALEPTCYTQRTVGPGPDQNQGSVASFTIADPAVMVIFGTRRTAAYPGAYAVRTECANTSTEVFCVPNIWSSHRRTQILQPGTYTFVVQGQKMPDSPFYLESVPQPATNTTCPTARPIAQGPAWLQDRILDGQPRWFKLDNTNTGLTVLANSTYNKDQIAINLLSTCGGPVILSNASGMGQTGVGDGNLPPGTYYAMVSSGSYGTQFSIQY